MKRLPTPPEIGATGSGRRLDSLVPAALVLAAGLAALVLRPAIPLDETRYLEVLAELSWRHPWRLTLDGVPYTEKTPLLLWIAQGLSLLGPSPPVALRLIPPLASAGTVLVVAALGRRLALPTASWVQAALLLPFVYGQVLLFDPLLTLLVWATLWAWSTDRDRLALVLAALAGMAKGPVALLFLGPLCACAMGLRTRRGAWPLVRVLGASVLPLLAWALVAGSGAGEGGLRELLWSSWGDRLWGTVHHQRWVLFYIPVVLVGALPCTPLLLVRSGEGGRSDPPTAFLARLPRVLLGLLLVFTAIRGKQPHYLLPLVPGLALWCGWKLEGFPRAGVWLRWGAAAQGLMALVCLVGVAAGTGALVAHFGSYGEDLVGSPAWWALLGLGLAGTGATLVLAILPRTAAPRRILAGTLVGMTCAMAPVHLAAGRLLLPQGFERILRAEPDTPLAISTSGEGGIFNWISGRRHLSHPGTTEELAAFAHAHPGALVIRAASHGPAIPAGWTVVARDRVRGEPHLLLRVGRGGEPGTAAMAHRDRGGRP